MSLDARPTVVGFDMPSAYARLGRPGGRTAIALLSCAPNQQWVDVFTKAVALIEGEAAWKDAAVRGATIEFIEPTQDTRAFFGSVRALVEKVSADAYLECVARRPSVESEVPTSFERKA